MAAHNFCMFSVPWTTNAVTLCDKRSSLPVWTQQKELEELRPKETDSGGTQEPETSPTPTTASSTASTASFIELSA
eukprot:3002341-Amphidinium_carterae.1